MMIKGSTVLQYILIYIVINFIGSIKYKMYMDQMLIIGLSLALLSILFYRIKISKRFFYSFILLSILLFSVSTLTNGSLSYASNIHILITMVISYTTVGLDRKNFIRRFILFSSLLMLISLLFYLCSYTPLRSYFTQILQSNGDTLVFNEVSYGGWTYHFMPYDTSNRNSGIFTEPGRYQILININIWLLLFYKFPFKSNVKKILLTMSVITLLTAQSTTGYLAFALIILFWIGSNYKYRIKNVLLIIFTIILIFSIGMSNNGFIYKNLVVKLEYNRETGEFTNKSSNSRLICMYTDIQLVLERPWGWGYDDLETIWKDRVGNTIWDTSSNVGLTRLLTVYGIAPWAYILYITITGFYKMRKTSYSFFAILAIYLATVLSQPVIVYTVFALFMYYKEEHTQAENYLKDNKHHIEDPFWINGSSNGEDSFVYASMRKKNERNHN